MWQESQSRCPRDEIKPKETAGVRRKVLPSFEANEERVLRLGQPPSRLSPTGATRRACRPTRTNTRPWTPSAGPRNGHNGRGTHRKAGRNSAESWRPRHDSNVRLSV